MKQIEHLNQFVDQLIDQHGDQLKIDRVQIDVELQKDAESYQGIAIRALAIIGGLLANLLFFGFILLTMNESAGILLFFGLATVTGVLAIDHHVKSTVLDSVCLGGYLAGFSMVGYSVNRLLNDDNFTVATLLVIALITLLYTSSFILNLFATISVNCCLYAFGNVNNISNFNHGLTAFAATGYVFLNVNEAKIIANSTVNKKYEALHAGFLISFAAILCDFCFGITKSSGLNWISSSIIITLTLYFIHQLITSLKLQTKAVMIYILSLAVLLPLIFAPSICGAILILLVGLHTRRRFSLVLGILGLIYFVGQFYYDLQYTLLVKSLIMFGTGILFLLAFFIIQKQLKRDA